MQWFQVPGGKNRIGRFVCGLCSRSIEVVVRYQTAWLEKGWECVGHSCGVPSCATQEEILWEDVAERIGREKTEKLKADAQRRQRVEAGLRRQRLLWRESPRGVA